MESEIDPEFSIFTVDDEGLTQDYIGTVRASSQKEASRKVQSGEWSPKSSYEGPDRPENTRITILPF